MLGSEGACAEKMSPKMESQRSLKNSSAKISLVVSWFKSECSFSNGTKISLPKEAYKWNYTAVTQCSPGEFQWLWWPKSFKSLLQIAKVGIFNAMLFKCNIFILFPHSELVPAYDSTTFVLENFR